MGFSLQEAVECRTSKKRDLHGFEIRLRADNKIQHSLRK